MGSGASAEHPYPDEAAALADGKTQDEIDAYKASLTAGKKHRFIYLPVVGRGEQIHLLCAEHGVEYETVLPKGFGGEYVWAEQAPHGTLPVWETNEEDGLQISDSLAIIDYILEKTPEGPAVPNDLRSRIVARETWMFCQDYYNHFLSPMHDTIMNHAEPHWRQGRNTDPRASPEHEKNSEYLAELKTYHTQRMNRLEKKLASAGTAFAAGEKFTYADIFVYTCVNTVLKCKGFTAFRESFGEAGPFEGCPTLVALAAKVGERPKIAEKAGKFEQAPV